MDRQSFWRGGFHLLVLLFALVIVACGGKNGDPPVLSLPVISLFTANPSSMTSGSTSTLSWTVTGADQLAISGIGSVTGNSVDVTPSETTTYTLTATNSAGNVTRSTTVTVTAALPVIDSFTATPATINAGDSCTLAWTVTGASSLSIDHGVGAMTGSSTSVSPAITTTYTLTATSDAGDVTSKATVTVNPVGAYFGQTPPGETPEVFAPGIVSLTDRFEGRIAFSPDGLECYITLLDASYSSMSLYVTQCVNNVWTPQVKAPFTTGFAAAGEAFFSADGNKVYFTAQLASSTTKADIWVVERSGSGWGTPTLLETPINSNANEYCFSQITDGTMYFLSNRSGAAQIYCVKPSAPQQAVLVPAPVLSVGTYEGDPCVAPDGHFLVFYSGRSGGHGGTDLYASFADGSGGWTTPVNLGTAFNSSSDEFGASLSPDGQYLFYVDHSSQKGDVHWVSTSAIEKLKP
jgi:hypothetical protein